MLDDSDVDLVALVSADGDYRSGLGAIVGLILLVLAVVFMVHYNKKECAQMHCEHGKPILADHECLCVEKATK